MAKQCSEKVRLNTVVLVCVQDEDHAGRHQDDEGGTWKRRD